jgi:AcrR family transcriptional regulator
MPDQRQRMNTRQTIVRSAVEVARLGGPVTLTLDAVAEHAGLSKGGLLYHFPGKDALIQAMIEDALARFEADVERLSASEDPGAGRWLRAFVKLTFAAEPEHDPGISLMAAAAINPDLLAPVSQFFARWQARACRDGLDPEFATVVRLAADGLWFADMFGAAAPEGDLRASVLDMLLTMISNAEKPVSER